MYNMEFNRREAARYFGSRGEPEEAIAQLLDALAAEAISAASPRTVYRIFDCAADADGHVMLGPLALYSRGLAKNLAGCGQAVLMAATLGEGIDLLLRRYSVTSVAKVAAMQAVGTSLIESVCDDLERSIKKTPALAGMWLRPRFSPGYGDLAIEVQRDFVRLLECDRRIGVTLTENCIMIPSKSVTAVIGIELGESPCAGIVQSCAACAKKDCVFRRPADDA